MSEKNMYSRSDDYRKKYLNKHKGILGIYTCSYCGKLCTKSGMQVDHIYPINGAKTKVSGKLWVKINTWYLPKEKRNQGINGVWNTTSACPTCNHIKSDLGGVWVWRGYIGRILFPIVNIILIGLLVKGLFVTIFYNNVPYLTKVVFLNVLFRIISYLLRNDLVSIKSLKKLIMFKK